MTRRATPISKKRRRRHEVAGEFEESAAEREETAEKKHQNLIAKGRLRIQVKVRGKQQKLMTTGRLFWGPPHHEGTSMAKALSRSWPDSLKIALVNGCAWDHTAVQLES